MTDFVTVGGVEMSTREYKALKYIIEFMANDALHQPPSHQELFAELNRQGEGLVSAEQTMRLAYSLRTKGLLVDASNYVGHLARRTRNLVPTPLGQKVVKSKPVRA